MSWPRPCWPWVPPASGISRTRCRTCRTAPCSPPLKKDDSSTNRHTRVQVAGVLDEPYSQLIPHCGVAVQARQSTSAGTVSILCSLAGRYGYSAELAELSTVRLKLPLQDTGTADRFFL